MKRNGPIPCPERRRSYRVIVSLPNDAAELVGFESDKSRLIENVLRLWYAMPEREREARLCAVRFNQRG